MSTPWPPPAGLTTQNVPRKSAILTISPAPMIIKAPAPLVFDTLRDTAAYGSWNTFVPRITVTSQPPGTNPPDSTHLHLGTEFTEFVVMDSSKPHRTFPTTLRVTDISTPEAPSAYVPQAVLEEDGSYTADLTSLYRIAWASTGTLAAWGLPTERINEVIVRGEGECEVRSWECQGGMVAHVVKWMYKKTLAEKFALWNEELKTFCEEKASGGGKTAAAATTTTTGES